MPPQNIYKTAFTWHTNRQVIAHLSQKQCQIAHLQQFFIALPQSLSSKIRYPRLLLGSVVAAVNPRR